jgi:hypothetical protein
MPLKKKTTEWESLFIFRQRDQNLTHIPTFINTFSFEFN